MKPVWMTPSACEAPRAEAVQVLQIAAMHLGTGGGERLGAGIRASKAEHLMTGAEEFLNNGRTDKAGGAGDEDTHGSFLCLIGSAPPCRRRVAIK